MVELHAQRAERSFRSQGKGGTIMQCVTHYGNMCVVGGILTYGSLSSKDSPSLISVLRDGS